MKSTSALVTGSGEDVVLLILSSDSSNAFHMDFHVEKPAALLGRSPDVFFIFIYLFLFKAIFWTQI